MKVVLRSEEVPENLDPLTSRISAKAKVNRLDRALAVMIAGVTNRLEKVVPVVPIAIGIGIRLFIRDQKVPAAFQNPQEEGVIQIVPTAIGIGMTAIKNLLERVMILSVNDRKVRLVSQRSLVSEVIPIPIAIETIETPPNKDHSGKQSQNHSYSQG